jgi:hypothetical protein
MFLLCAHPTSGARARMSALNVSAEAVTNHRRLAYEGGACRGGETSGEQAHRIPYPRR